MNLKRCLLLGLVKNLVQVGYHLLCRFLARVNGVIARPLDHPVYFVHYTVPFHQAQGHRMTLILVLEHNRKRVTCVILYSLFDFFCVLYELVFVFTVE